MKLFAAALSPAYSLSLSAGRLASCLIKSRATGTKRQLPLRLILISYVILTGTIASTASATPAVTQAENFFAPADTDAEVSSAAAFSCDAQMTRRQLAQLTGVMVSFEDLSHVARYARRGEISLLGLLGEPDNSLEQKIEQLQAVSQIPVLVGSDEESRSVQRLENLIYRLPSSRSMVASGVASVSTTFEDYGKQMRALGVQMSFGPVADVGRGPGIGYRSFGTDADVVTKFSTSVIDGFTAAGVVPVIKHFPGHGMATADTHHRPAKTPPLAELQEQLMVFRELINKQVAVMVGHLLVPDLTDGLPASLSRPAISQLLRDELGFKGLVITDSLDMSAITSLFTQAEAGLKAILAGADVALVSTLEAQQQLLDLLVSAFEDGRLKSARVQQSLDRVYQVKSDLFSDQQLSDWQLLLACNR